MLVTIVFSLATAIALTLFVAQRPFRRAPLWGALWGCFFGFWLLVPVMLNVHHMPSLSLRQWAILDGAFAAAFAVLGAILSTGATLPIGLLALIRRKDFRNPAWAYSIWAAVWLPLAYLGLSGVVEWTNFARPPSMDAYLSMVGRGVAWYLAIVGVLLLLYRKRAAHGWDPRGRTLSYGLSVLAIAGCVVVPFRVEGGARAAVAAPPLTSQPHRAKAAPLLVIGLDGGNWRTLAPLIERGLAPTFARLAAEGVRGEVEALWPPYWSTPAWGAILTGFPQDEVGVYEDLSATMPGFPPFELPLTLNLALNPLFALEFVLIRAQVIEPTPTPRTALQRTPVWERLSRAGTRTAVVRFPFTYPAAGQADYVISNRVVVDLWDMLGVEQGEHEQLVAPASRARELLGVFSGEDSVDLTALVSRPDWPKPADAIVDPLEVVKTVAGVDTRMNIAARHLVRGDPRLSVLMVHVTGFDNISHAFWQYRFPGDFPENPPAAADVEQLGPVVDRYLQMIDRQLAELIAAFPTPPNVLVVADHGEGPSHSYPMWRGWHDSPGLFLAAGPSIAHQGEMIDVSYYDIVPTILELQGFERPSDLRGQSVIDSLPMHVRTDPAAAGRRHPTGGTGGF